MDHPHRRRGPDGASCKREIETSTACGRKSSASPGSVRAPALLQRETSLTRGIIRAFLRNKVDSLLVDSKVLHH